jgi:hypothetical protein
MIRFPPRDAGGVAVPAGAAWWVIAGGWLDRKRIRLATRILLAAQTALFAFFVAGTHGWIVKLPGPTTTDFVSFYAAGKLADAGSASLAYDHAVHLAAEESVAGTGIGYQFFNYPPVYILPFAALAPLPYLVAFVIFEAVTLALYLVAAMCILGERGLTALIALLAFPIVFWNFGLGQNAFLTAALFGGATLLVDRRPVVAGLVFGALCYKPQFGLLVPLALAAAGRWRAFAAAAASAGGLVLLSLMLFGADSWRRFFEVAGGSHAMYASGRILFGGMANVFGAARLIGAGAPFAYTLQAVASLVAAAVVVVVWRRGLSLPVRAATLAAATLVAAPLALLYDLMLGAVAASWLIGDRHSPAARNWEKSALAALYLVVLHGPTHDEQWRVPVYPLAALALFAIVTARAWREAALDRGAVCGCIAGDSPLSAGAPRN